MADLGMGDALMARDAKFIMVLAVAIVSIEEWVVLHSHLGAQYLARVVLLNGREYVTVSESYPALRARLLSLNHSHLELLVVRGEAKL